MAKALLPKLEENHRALLVIQPKVSSALAALVQRMANLDARHDGLDARLFSEAQVETDLEVKEAILAVRSQLFPRWRGWTTSDWTRATTVSPRAR